MTTTPQQKQEEQKPAPVVKTTEQKLTDLVIERVRAFQESKTLHLPPGYSPENAVRSAYLVLLETETASKKPVLEACTQSSIANAVLKMVLLGLNPQKKQCSFIAYGNQLSCDVEYSGNIAIAKRHGLKSVKAGTVFEGDEFEFEIDHATGRKFVTKHKQTLESLGSQKIRGAYAITEMENGAIDCEIMSLAQIQKAWEQGATKGNSPAHKNFPDQMAMKTVINRAIKLIIRTSDDSDLVLAGKNTEFAEDANKKEIASNLEKEALKNAEDIGFEDATETTPPPPVVDVDLAQEEASTDQEVPVVKTEAGQAELALGKPGKSHKEPF